MLWRSTLRQQRRWCKHNCVHVHNYLTISPCVQNLIQISGDYTISSVWATLSLRVFKPEDKQFLSSYRLIILDEVDQLDCHGQEVLYTLFEWPALPKSKLLLIGKSLALS